ncbi:hypothetical protein [Acidiferrobacter sp. SPIII_3]|uniref:hypothetical protein n=1 Tax=Acidiferrobacter sp. SPIII_3 TaxID=1281578 RepID=UPI0011AB89A1|nr:hypothetical protein [Acidiferrobacter sp. SPIII_3]
MSQEFAAGASAPAFGVRVARAAGSSSRESASAAIARTVEDIEKILAGENLKISGPKRAALREKIQAALIKSSRSWYKKGFNRGHKEAFRAHKTHKHVPETLEVEVEREFVPNTKRRVPLKSTLTKAFREKA